VLVGGYRLLAKIGEGGMGVVHLARRDDGERVALKVLRPQVVGDEDGRARLDREVDSLSRVHSRWVAEIVDADPWAAVPWIATRYVPGLSLHDHVLEEGPVRGADLLWFAGCLAEGLDAVHAVGQRRHDVSDDDVVDAQLLEQLRDRTYVDGHAVRPDGHHHVPPESVCWSCPEEVVEPRR